MPSDWEEVKPEEAGLGTKAVNATGSFLSSLASSLNPIPLINLAGKVHLATHSGFKEGQEAREELAKIPGMIGEVSTSEKKKAEQATGLLSKAGHYIGSVPLIGAPIGHATSQFEEGDPAGGFGTLASLLAPTAALRGVKALKARLPSVGPLIPSALSAEEEAAVNALQKPLPATATAPEAPPISSLTVGQKTGNAGVQSFEDRLSKTTYGSPVINKSLDTTKKALGERGKALAERVSPVAGENIDIGKNVTEGTRAHRKEFNALAKTQYDDLRSGLSGNTKLIPEPNPNKAPMPTSTAIEDYVKWKDANPDYIQVPMASPVDITKMEKMRGLYDYIKATPEIQRQYAKSYRVLGKLMDRLDSGATAMPAADFDEILGQLKGIERAVGAETKDGRAILQTIEQGENAVKSAIPPELHNKLLAARDSVKEYKRTDDLLQEIGATPRKKGMENYAKIFKKLAQNDNMSEVYLSKLAKIDPDMVAQVGRHKLEQILSNESTALKQFDKLGPTTQKLYFGANAPDIRQFLVGVEKVLKTQKAIAPGRLNEVSGIMKLIGQQGVSGLPTSLPLGIGSGLAPQWTAEILTGARPGARLLTEAIGGPSKPGALAKGGSDAAKAAVLARYMELAHRDQAANEWEEVQ